MPTTIKRMFFFLTILDVIHTVGPQGKQPDKLRECYERSLALAKENRLKSIAFPCISTGIYGYPQRDAAEIAIGTVKRFFEINTDDVRLLFSFLLLFFFFFFCY